MKQYLVVVDMQKDFVDGALGTPEAEAIIPASIEKIRNFEGDLFVTYDTHFEDYSFLHIYPLHLLIYNGEYYTRSYFGFCP